MNTPNPCDQPCPKCGSADVSILFVATGELVKNEAYDICWNKFSSGQCNAYYATRDHLDCTCRRCQYRWQLKPLAKRKAKGAA